MPLEFTTLDGRNPMHTNPRKALLVATLVLLPLLGIPNDASAISGT